MTMATVSHPGGVGFIVMDLDDGEAVRQYRELQKATTFEFVTRLPRSGNIEPLRLDDLKYVEGGSTKPKP